MIDHPWPELVERLEAIALENHFLDPDGLRMAMEERQQIIAGLMATDPRELDDELRGELKDRLAKVYERDQLLLAAMQRLKDQTREEMEKANSGMRAMNGYKAIVSSQPPPFRRIG